MLCELCETLEYTIPGLNASKCPSCGWVGLCSICGHLCSQFVPERKHITEKGKQICYPCGLAKAALWTGEKAEERKEEFRQLLVTTRLDSMGLDIARAMGIDTQDIRNRKTNYSDMVPADIAQDIEAGTGYGNCYR